MKVIRSDDVGKKLSSPSAVGTLAKSSGVGTLINSSGVGTLVIPSGVETLVNSSGVGTLVISSGVGTLVNSSGVGTLVVSSEVGTLVISSEVGTLVISSGVRSLANSSGVGTLSSLRSSKPITKSFSDEAMAAKRKRPRFERQWKSTRGESDRVNYRRACRRANRLINESRRVYFHRRLSDCIDSGKNESRKGTPLL